MMCLTIGLNLRGPTRRPILLARYYSIRSVLVGIAQSKVMVVSTNLLECFIVNLLFFYTVTNGKCLTIVKMLLNKLW